MPASLEGKPLIVVNAESTQAAHRSVYPDEFQGAYAATEELIRAGHTSIAFINLSHSSGLRAENPISRSEIEHLATPTSTIDINRSATVFVPSLVSTLVSTR